MQSWIDEAALIVVVLGKSKWVKWELEQVLSRGHAAKLIIVVPQKFIEASDAGDLRDELCGDFVDSVSSTKWKISTRSLSTFNTLRCIVLKEDGEVLAIGASSRSKESLVLSFM